MSLEGCGCGEWFAVLFDARRHRRGIGSERWAVSSVFDVENEQDGGVFGALFGEDVVEGASNVVEHRQRGCQTARVCGSVGIWEAGLWAGMMCVAEL